MGERVGPIQFPVERKQSAELGAQLNRPINAKECGRPTDRRTLAALARVLILQRAVEASWLPRELGWLAAAGLSVQIKLFTFFAEAAARLLL